MRVHHMARGLVALTAGTLQPIVERIAAETSKAMKHPDVAARLGPLGTDYLGKVVKDANIKPVE
jgi:hypothetical protein